MRNYILFYSIISLLKGNFIDCNSYYRCLLVFLILLDVALISWALAIGSSKKNPGDRLTLTIIAGTDLVISVFFIFEIGLRMFSMTPQVYFSKRYWYNVLDSIFITLGFVFGIVELVLMQVMQYSLNIFLIYNFFCDIHENY